MRSKFIRMLAVAGGLFLAAGLPAILPRPVVLPARAHPVPATSAQTLPNVNISVNQVVASGFSAAVQVTHAGDGSGRLFVVEKGGRIRIIKNGSVLSTPFLNISSLVSTGSEQGLLGLAFHPNYATNGYFYIDYTNTTGDTVIARYSVSANPDVANPSSAVTLLGVNQPYVNHNGGQLQFGPLDGYLYISLGDGGSGGDPQNHAQNKNDLLGTILRLDVDGGSPYAIPPDNPYVGQPGADEIWAIGLRNPWRFSFDRLTGDMYIGDVGQNAWEEISFQAAGTPGGLNFGWRCKEGTHNYNFSGSCGSESLTGPIAEYDHPTGFAVTGGFVYRGSVYPALQGRYFYADYSTRKIWSIYKSGGGWSAPELEIANAGFNISAFGEDEQGELYVVDYGGSIRRLVDADAAPNLSGSAKSASVSHADPGETLTYTLVLSNSGALLPDPLYLRDSIPAGLDYVLGSLTATAGSPDDSAAPLLRWQGTTASSHITLTYRVTANGAITGTLANQAVITGPTTAAITRTALVAVPRPRLDSTLADFFLPGTQPNQLNTPIPESAGCDFCHTDPVYNRWRGSMMAQAGRDPLFWAALAVANNDAAGAGEFCLRCHVPGAWLAGRSQPPDGSALQPADLREGVTCELCHRLVDPVPGAADSVAAIDAAIRAALNSTVPVSHTGSAMLIVDPEDRRRGPFTIPPAQQHSAFQADFQGQSANAVTESRLCGTCHNIDNPLLSWDSGRGQFWPNANNMPAPSLDNGQLFPIERTFDEWLNSDFASGGVILPKFAGSKPDGRVESCQDCHMPRSTGIAAEQIYNPAFRDCQTTGCLPEHQLVGGNSWVPQILQDTRWRLHSADDALALDATVRNAQAMLRRAATLTVTLTSSGTQKIATVRVTNDSGHKLPTGYPEGRRMWLNLRAYRADGSLVYESGAYNPATAELTPDAALKIYETKQGLTPELAALVGRPAGESFHFALNNTVIKDNRIPPRGYTQSAFDRPGLRPVGAVFADGQYWDDTTYILPADAETVAVFLYYQTASKEYVDFLRANGGPDGAALGTLWDSSRSPPELMTLALANPRVYYLPVIRK